MKQPGKLNQYDRPLQLFLHSKILLSLKKHNSTGVHTHSCGVLEAVTKIIHVQWGHQFSAVNQQRTMKKDTP